MRDTLARIGMTLVLSALVVATVTGVLLVGLDGWAYYLAPVAERGYMAQHAVLRPSGPVGQWLGMGGVLLMLAPVAYAVRKRLRRSGNMKAWLEVHVFCGIVGPVLVSFHTSFKFNGLVSVAYWSMVLVALSGVVGRYLYVRIPRSLRGQELTRAEIEERIRALGEDVAAARLPEAVLARLEAFERRVVPDQRDLRSWFALVSGELALRRETHQIVQQSQGEPSPLYERAVELIAERATLARRTAALQKTKTLFDLWHVFHMPLVYAMFAIVGVHVAFTLYLGYVPFGD